MDNLIPPHGDRRPVAYLNEQFLNGPEARGIRILSEFLEPFAHFRREKVRDTVVFFGYPLVKNIVLSFQDYQITSVYSISLMVDHISNANLGNHNAGITNAGARVGIKF